MAERTLLLTFHPAREEPPETDETYFAIESGSPALLYYAEDRQWFDLTLGWEGCEREDKVVHPDWWAEIPTDYKEWASDE